MSDEARRQIHGWTRAIRAGNEAVAEAKMLASNAYALWNALLDLCPWCKKAVQKEKVVDPPVCPRCHRDLLADDPDLHQFWEANWKSIRDSHMAEKNAKELELLREESVGTKSKPKKPINKE